MSASVNVIVSMRVSVGARKIVITSVRSSVKVSVGVRVCACLRDMSVCFVPVYNKDCYVCVGVCCT